MLVNRWAILRTAMPKNITIRKTIALVNALVKLHNFCIDELVDMDDVVIESSPLDTYNIMNMQGGYVSLEESEDHDVPIPSQLLDGGDHFADFPRDKRRQRNDNMLPRKLLHDKVVESHKVRPSTNSKDVS